MTPTVKRFVRLRSKEGEQWFVAPQLRQKIVQDAETSNSNMNDVAVRILAGRFGVAVSEAHGRKSVMAEVDNEKLVLRLPPALNEALELRRIMGGSRQSVQDVIRQTLCEHYGLRTPPPPRRGRPPRAAVR